MAATLMLRLRPKSSPFCHPDSMGAFAIIGMCPTFCEIGK
jgi:hypothetical protein